MKLIQVNIRNFRRLEDVLIEFEESETVFVGPNNSGKTSATDVFRLFLKSGDFSIHDFSVSQSAMLDKYGRGEIDENSLPQIELDLWFSINPDTEFGRSSLLLPDAEQDYDKVGLRLRYRVNDSENLKES
jgi:putative ATP-dependent endonuclease of the OLD family